MLSDLWRCTSLSLLSDLWHYTCVIDPQQRVANRHQAHARGVLVRGYRISLYPYPFEVRLDVHAAERLYAVPLEVQLNELWLRHEPV